MTTDRYYDRLETRDPAARERALMAELPGLVALAQRRSPYYAETLKGVDAAGVSSRAALARLPVTRKHDLIALMKRRPPFGGLGAVPPSEAALIFTSPGPIFEFATDRPDYYGGARALHAAGFRKGDIVHNCFAYHLTPGAWIIHAAARALGCPVIPGGVGNTEQQVQVMAQVRASAYAGTPDFLKTMIETADKLGLDLSALKKGIVGGGPYFPALRQFYAARGIQVSQTFATAELGNVAYESPGTEGLIVAEDKIVEVLVPGTGDPVARAGDVGELVVTTLNPDYPLIRFATGDLTAVLPGTSPCGRTNMRIKGWLGRADQTTKVRGMFVHPEQIAEIVRRHREIGRARLVVDQAEGRDRPTLRCETAAATAPAAATALVAAIGETFQNVCKVRAEIVLVPPGALPNDGKVIEDARKIA